MAGNPVALRERDPVKYAVSDSADTLEVTAFVCQHPHRRKTEHLLSPQELAAFLGLGLTSTYSLLKAGVIPSVRIGRLRKVRRSDVEKFIEDRLEDGDE